MTGLVQMSTSDVPVVYCCKNTGNQERGNEVSNWIMFTGNVNLQINNRSPVYYPV